MWVFLVISQNNIKISQSSKIISKMPTLKSLARSWHMSGEFPKINSVNETCRYRESPKMCKHHETNCVFGWGFEQNIKIKTKHHWPSSIDEIVPTNKTKQPNFITDSMTTWGVIVVEYLRRSSARRMTRSLKWWNECSFHFEVEQNKPC